MVVRSKNGRAWRVQESPRPWRRGLELPHAARLRPMHHAACQWWPGNTDASQVRAKPMASIGSACSHTREAQGSASEGRLPRRAGQPTRAAAATAAGANTQRPQAIADSYRPTPHAFSQCTRRDHALLRPGKFSLMAREVHQATHQVALVVELLERLLHLVAGGQLVGLRLLVRLAGVVLQRGEKKSGRWAAEGRQRVACMAAAPACCKGSPQDPRCGQAGAGTHWQRPKQRFTVAARSTQHDGGWRRRAVASRTSRLAAWQTTRRCCRGCALLRRAARCCTGRAAAVGAIARAHCMAATLAGWHEHQGSSTGEAVQVGLRPLALPPPRYATSQGAGAVAHPPSPFYLDESHTKMGVLSTSIAVVRHRNVVVGEPAPQQRRAHVMGRLAEC